MLSDYQPVPQSLLSIAKILTFDDHYDEDKHLFENKTNVNLADVLDEVRDMLDETMAMMNDELHDDDDSMGSRMRLTTSTNTATASTNNTNHHVHAVLPFLQRDDSDITTTSSTTTTSDDDDKESYIEILDQTMIVYDNILVSQDAKTHNDQSCSNSARNWFSTEQFEKSR